MKMLNGFIIQNDSGQLAKFAFLIDSLTAEVIEELSTQDEETIGRLMEGMGEVIAWIGHGDNERLPDPMRQFANEIQPPVTVQAEIH